MGRTKRVSSDINSANIFNIEEGDDTLVRSAKADRAIKAKIRLSEMIYDAMDETGTTKEKLATILGVSVSSVSGILTGKYDFKISVLVRLEQILEVDLISSALFNTKELQEEYRVKLYNK